METIIILAVSENNVIGKDNKLIWHISGDLKRFKSLTYGYPVIMGRLCFESMGKPLPGRTNIIISRDKDYKADGCIVRNSIDAAINTAQKYSNKKIFIAGGEQIYKLFIELADKIYLTRVHSKFDGDAFFKMPAAGWKEIWREEHQDEKPYAYTFLIYERSL